MYILDVNFFNIIETYSYLAAFSSPPFFFLNKNCQTFLTCWSEEEVQDVTEERTVALHLAAQCNKLGSLGQC